MKRNAYTILGVPVNASLDEVRQAYIRLAKLHHPDVCKESDASDWMKNLNLAYEAIRGGRGDQWSPSISHAIPDPPAGQTLAEKIEWANTHAVDDNYLIRMFVGGHDAYSKISLSGLESRAGSDIAQKVRGATTDYRLRSIALRWYLRGLNSDLAIRKACADGKLYHAGQRVPHR